MKSVSQLYILFAVFSLFAFLTPNIAFANNPPSQNDSSISTSGTAPADGSSTITVTVSLADSQGSPDVGDNVTFSDSDSANTLSPTSATLSSSGQASFTVTSTTAETNEISVTDTTSGTTLNNLGQITFTTPSSATPTPTPTPSSSNCSDTTPGTPNLSSAVAQGANNVILTWTDSSDPVTGYNISYGTSTGHYDYGATNVGGQGTTTYNVGSLTGGVTYYFVVSAVNGCQPGGNSNEVSATTAGGYVAPTSIPSNTDSSTLGTEASPDTPTDTPSDTPIPTSAITPLPTPAAGMSTSKLFFYILFPIFAVAIIGGGIFWKIKHKKRRRRERNLNESGFPTNLDTNPSERNENS